MKFLYYNSAGIDAWFNGFECSNVFGDDLLDLLANCNKIENVDYSKFIVYLMLSKFCPNTDIPTTPLIIFPNTLKPNYLENLATTFMYYKKYITVYKAVKTRILEIRSCYSVIVENSLIASTFLNIIMKQEYKYRPQIAFAINFTYYLCLLF